MINLLKMQEHKIEMWRLKRMGRISQMAFDARMEVKDEQMYLELKRLSALLCRTCEEIGTPNTVDLTVNLETSKDE